MLIKKTLMQIIAMFFGTKLFAFTLLIMMMSWINKRTSKIYITNLTNLFIVLKKVFSYEEFGQNLFSKT
jgi:hypothetical protein